MRRSLVPGIGGPSFKRCMLVAAAATFALPSVSLAQGQPRNAESYDVAKMTDLGQIPEELYSTVMYGPIDGETSSPLVAPCLPLSSYVWRNNFGSDPYAPSPSECKPFRYPIVVLLHQSMEIHGVPCNGGLVAFHRSERLAFCLLSARVTAGPDQFEPGQPISFDEQGDYRYPSESRRSTILIDADPGCREVEVANAATGATQTLGSTPISFTNEIRLWLLKCQCPDGSLRIGRRVCFKDCPYRFDCRTGLR